MRSAALLLVFCCTAKAAPLKQPTFSARRDYVATGNQIAVADVNGDGIPDVIAVATIVTTLLGKGDGTFRPGPYSQSCPQWNYVTSFAAADLTGTGKIDLVIEGWPYGGGPAGIGVCLGNGDGTFAAPIFYQMGSDQPSSVAIGDFNGDGIPDAITVGESGVWLFTGKGGGAFSPGVLIPETRLGGSVVAADFNRDGKLDLATGSAGGFAVIFGNGDGTFQTPVGYKSASGSIQVANLSRGAHPTWRWGLAAMFTFS
jgi:hypothetical protein